QAPAGAELADRLEVDERTVRVVPLGRAAVRRREIAADLAAKAERARLRALALTPPCTCQDPDALFDTACTCEPAEGLAEVRLWRDELARLDGFRGHAAKHLKAQHELKERRAGLALAEQAEERLAAELAELPGTVEAGRELLGDTRIKAAGIEAAQKDVTEAGRLVEQGRRRDLVRRSVATAEEALRSAADEAQRARQTHLDLREERLNGMAAVLAAQLVDGLPCGVCGSPEHPAPATGLGGVPSEESERAAGQAADRAQRARETAEVKLAGLRVELDGLIETTDAPVETLAEALDSARSDLELRQAARLRCDELERQLAAGEHRLSELRLQHTEAVRQRTELAAALQNGAAEELRLREELDRARGADPSLQARIQRLTSEAELVAAAVTAAEQSETAQLELRKAEEELVTASADAGFATPEQAAAAVVHDRAPLEAQARRHDAEEAAVRELLADPVLHAAAAAPAADLAALESALHAAEAHHTRVAQAHDRARLRCDRLGDLTAHLAGQLRDWEPAAEAHAVVTRLAGVTSGQSGDNRKNMRLSAYVLSARLGQVVDAANERLGTMSAGRYLLKHSDDRSAADRSRNSGGLGLRVIDGWTGQDRDPATLSGGESFITSLSLALGLADVVTAEAGGTEISTLFVDEGFGTLDEDTLDEVMDVLDALRDGGRTVGVVSHVAELRVRIPAQLRLHKSRTGSRTSVHA
ncbi:SbcC/MukB-like Walker B domain-containing protein, partial [Actinocorallia longicatena]|uniref:SbcC/MukB-like Walker B domain-containing protein n=1 Tax=Actinocorallia longicatena TaxID=111803 RepID=UPI0031DAB826